MPKYVIGVIWPLNFFLIFDSYILSPNSHVDIISCTYLEVAMSCVSCTTKMEEFGTPVTAGLRVTKIYYTKEIYFLDFLH